MRRVRTFQLLSTAFACGGVASLLFADRSEPHALAGALSPMLLLLSTAAAWVVLGTLRRGCDTLTRQVTAGIPNSSHEPAAGAGPLAPLGNAVRSVVESAERSTAESAAKVRELEIRLKVALAERQHAEAILYSISDAVLVTDPFDDVVLANESAARAFEFDLASANRAPVDQLLHDPTIVQLIRDVRHSGGRTGRRIIEHQIDTPFGKRVYKVTLSSVAEGRTPGPASVHDGHLDEGPDSGVVVVLHDVTREKEVSDMKNDFVSMVSHELRTPLASIKAYIEMLIDGEAVDEKTTREFYDVIQNEANRLGRLIDNILSISRIEAGLVKVNREPQSLTVVVKEALEVISPQARLKRITVTEQLTPVFYRTRADHDMLYQAILNLLSNSVKYTPEGGTIAVQTSVDETSKKVVIQISDNGVGIPPKDLPFVFDKFYRAESNSRMAQGTGLGLSLVKEIVETVHEGRMFVESQVGKGSSFGFELDLYE